MLKLLKHARLDNSYDAELRKFVAVDLLILDDFAIDVLDSVESRDLYDLLLERYFFFFFFFFFFFLVLGSWCLVGPCFGSWSVL